ncbi:MAG: LPS export ABC transporter periplasmic protein LptC [Nitrospirae bacterium]|nr:LPS export ABC transporter periplasmic protein LptC [Nitrospirota bacterium]
MWQRWARGSLLALSVILASFLFYLLATRVESVPPPSSASSSPLNRADAGVDQFTFTQTKSGAVQWEVQAQRARVFETEHRAALEKVRVTLYGANGWEMKLEGDEGTIDIHKKDFVLAKHVGPIAVQLESGYTIYTNHLAWADARREISTQDPVTLSGHGLEVTGRGLVGKLDVEEFKVLEDVRVEILQ